MSEQHPSTSPQEPRTLESRVAAIEDRLAQLTVTEEEMRAYQKVAALLTGRTVATGPLATQVSPTASAETTGGPGAATPLFVAPHAQGAVAPHAQSVAVAPVPVPPVPFPTLPVINSILIGGIPTAVLHFQDIRFLSGQPLTGGVGFPRLGQ